MPMLLKADVTYLLENTTFDEYDIREWFREFIKDCPDGVLTKEKAIQIYSTLGMTSIDDLVNNIFSVFDRDCDGVLSFREFLVATHETASGSPQQKLRWQFRLYDKDGSGSVELKEMVLDL